jgi:two-component system response regulator FixJ
MQNDVIVHIIDDDDAVRDSLVFVLASSGIEATAYESAAAFLEKFTGIEKGCCVITDIRMPEVSGMDLLRRVKEKRPDLPVIIITGHGDVPLAVEAMKLGAVDFLEKPFDDDSLLTAVRTALAGEREGGGVNEQTVEFKARLETLSAREREVLQGLVAGHPNKVIAFDLGISPRTVEVYRANVMTKMRANTLSELVRMAVLSDSM